MRVLATLIVAAGLASCSQPAPSGNACKADGVLSVSQAVEQAPRVVALTTEPRLAVEAWMIEARRPGSAYAKFGDQPPGDGPRHSIWAQGAIDRLRVGQRVVLRGTWWQTVKRSEYVFEVEEARPCSDAD
jgi:hypothetical protein